VWVSLCAAKSRPSDRDHGGKGGEGDPKLGGKVSGEIPVSVSVRNLDEPCLRFPFGGSRAKRWSVGAALLGTMVAIMFPVRAEALSCLRPEQFYDDRHGERRDAGSLIGAFVGRAGIPRACTRARAAVPR